MQRISWIFLASLLSVVKAAAVTDTVTFNGTVLGTCLITIGTPGTLAASPDYTVLGSNEATGVPGTATILTTAAGYSVSTAAPVSFTDAPVGGNDNVTFASSYSASGVTTVLDVVGSVVTPLGVGLTNVDVDLTATKSSGHFSEGSYIAEVVVTCE